METKKIEVGTPTRMPRKYLIAIAVLIPFVLGFTLWKAALWKADGNTSEQTGRLISSLPEVRREMGEGLDKFDQYELAMKDSQRVKELFWDDQDLEPQKDAFTPISAGYQEEVLPQNTSGESVAQQIYSKLSQLEKELSPVQAEPNQKQIPWESTDIDPSDVLSARFQDTLDPVAINTRENDKELEVLNGMLDKVIAIQNPEAAVRPQIDSPRLDFGQPVRVSAQVPRGGISKMTLKESGTKGAGFISILGTNGEEEATRGSVPASVRGDQVVTNGSTIRLGILREAKVGNKDLEAGHLVYGKVRINSDRLEIEVTSIRVGNHILPVSLVTYGLDGMPGIQVPISQVERVAGESVESGMGSIGNLGGVDAGWGIQVAEMGARAARQLASRKLRQVKVSLPAGFRVLLYDKKEKTEAILR